MKKYIFLILICILMIGCERRIGGQTDEHGCLIAAGYQWCETTQKCQRFWEEPCPSEIQEELSGLTPEDCEIKGGKTAKECNQDETSIGEIRDSNNLCCAQKGAITQEQAVMIAQNSDCVKEGNLTDEIMYNEITQTWWIDLELKETKEYCNPACVVYVANRTAEINWRCTGAVV